MEETVTDIDQQVEQPPKKLSVKEFAAKIKAKYPDYNSINDDELVQKIIAKYPDYSEQVDLSQKKSPSNNASTPSGTTYSEPSKPEFKFDLKSPREVALGQMSRPDETISKNIERTLTATDTQIHGAERKQARLDLAEKKKKAAPIAIDNAARKSLKIKGLNPNNAALLNKEKSKFALQLATGDADVSFDKDGNAGLMRSPGIFESFNDHMKNAINTIKEAREFKDMSRAQRIEFANKKAQEIPSPYIGTKESSAASFTGLLGDVTPTLGLYGAAGATGGVIEATGGTTAIPLRPVMTFAFNAGSGANNAAMNNVLDRYYTIKQRHPELNDEAAMAQAEKGEDIDRLAGITETALFSTAGGGSLGKTTTGKLLKGIAKSGIDLGAKTSAVEFGRSLAQGEGGQDAYDKAIKKFEENAPVGSLLHATTAIITGAMKAPVIIKNSLKHDVVTKMPQEEVQSLLQKNVEEGNITQEQADKVSGDIKEFRIALNKVPDGLPEDAQASVAGLILKRDNLKKEAELKDESAKDIHNQEIESINNQIKEIYRTGKPLEHEINESTGEPYKQPTFDDVQKKRVEDLADKIANGKRIEDAEDLQTQANFPDEVAKQLERLKKEETSANKDKEKPNTEVSKNVDKYLKQQEPQSSSPKEKLVENKNEVKSILESDVDLKGKPKGDAMLTEEEYVKIYSRPESVYGKSYSEDLAKEDYKEIIKTASEKNDMVFDGQDYWWHEPQDNIWFKLDKDGEVIHDQIADVKPSGKGVSQYEYEISLGKMTADDAKTLIEKVGLKAPKEITDLSKSQSKEESIVEDKPVDVPLDKGNAETPPPIEHSKEEVSREGEGTKITHAATEILREENKLPEYEKTPQTLEQWNKEADERIKNGEMPSVIRKYQSGDIPNEVEQTMMGKYIASLNAEVEKNPNAENLNAFQQAVELSDKVGGTIWGRSGRARQQVFLPEDSLGASMMKEAQSLGLKDVNELSETQKQRVIDEQKEVTRLKEEIAKKDAEIESMRNEAAAKEKVAEFSKKRTNKPANKDYAAERQSLKDKLKEQFEKYKSSGQKLGIASDGNVESFKLTVDMAKTITEIIKSHAEETAAKFETIINKVFDDVKEVIDGISRKDIIDVAAGVYSEKRATISELASKLRDFRTEAKLLNVLEQERLGETPASDRKRNVKSRRIDELQKKIKEIRDRRNDTEPVEKTDAERLAAQRKFIQKSIEQIEADVKAGRFEKPKRQHPVILDKRTQALQDRLIELEAQQAIRRQKNDYEKTSKFTKVADTIWQALGLKRLVNAAIDFSILFRQASPITMNVMKWLPRIENGRLKMNTAPKAVAEMFNLAFNPKGFKRFQYGLEKSSNGRLFTHFNGTFSNPTEVRMEKREEEFSNSLLSRIHQKIENSDNATLKKGAEIAERIWFSERAAAALLNTIRIEEFSKWRNILEKQGLTPENAPEEYKATVKYVMNQTGRGNMLKSIEDSHAARVLANRTYFGARLMAAKINLLNPVYYAKMPKEMRVQVIKDVAGNVTTLFLTGLALKASGATVSLNPDDPDFLQARFGKKVYDISGGSVAYVRTFLRMTSAVSKIYRNPQAKQTKSYTGFAGSSALKTLVTNKLSPNTAYLYHFFTQQSGEYDEAGHKKPFDPYEVFKIYPLYVDGTIQAFKEGGMGDALTILMPDMVGIGTQQYNKKEGGSGGGGGASSGRIPTIPHPKEPKMPTLK